MVKVAALVGDYWHGDASVRAGLEAAILRLSNKDEIELQYISYQEVSHVIDNQPNLFINAKMNKLNPKDKQVITWLTEELDKKIETYVKAGGSFLAWHAGLAGYPSESSYTQMLRGAFDYHPPGLQGVIYIQKEKTFNLADEHYFVTCDEANTEVYLRSTGIEGDSIAGWKHRYGKGKICCLTPAHTREGMLNENVSSLLASKIDWLLNK
ncbi:ThuA domain-containing protein [Neobacillus niacini]|uniref:ThuA domain-containing protein n=1 Tax=Neobacillus niacini TaxID=86668 RepID=UPI0030033ACF